MLHEMRSISERPTKPAGATAAGSASVEAILTEVSGWVGELRCHSMGRLVQGTVTMGQLHVLWLLQHHGAMSMSRLAELVGVSLSNATGIIDRMEEHGLIERARVDNDRRLVVVQPAAAGLQALSETETQKRDRLRSVLSHLSPTERPIVLAALQSLRRAVSAEAESAPVHQHHFTDAAN